MARRTLVVPPRRDLPIVASMALFRLTAVTVLVFTALELVPAGRSSVVVWTSSLWTVPIAAIFLGERMTGARWVGLSLGIAGVLALFEPWGFDWTEPGVAVGHALLILAAITNALDVRPHPGPSLEHRSPRLDAMAVDGGDADPRRSGLRRWRGLR